MATCAACLHAIPNGARFVTAGTEVFHGECAKDIENSIGWRRKKALVELRAELTHTQHQLAEAKAVADREREIAGRMVTEARQDRDRAQRSLDSMMRDLNNARATIGDATSIIAQLRTERDALRTERKAAVAARDAAIREAQLHQTIQGQSHAVSESEPASGKDDLRDASEQRFSLLELD